ncbi:FMN reductase [Conexibacter sp. W3-3-2]|uniref:NADPH-dependent FMN reductase n=1 Tax=Conexibacter sp. W3-3-2 TaxID=2675227 RepID=UPI0012B6AC90|nr:NADPH-dependent FMN reductase [Conexibacter sp. W3-3-2]MTD46484.1 FMN reductase [Conexibacter sp. W3-3-2]
MRVLGLAGSLRAGSHSARLLALAGSALPAGAELVTWSRLGELPLYDPDVDARETHPVVESLRDAIREADALVIVTPEYNASVSGVLKNAIDWASRPRATTALQSKPVAVVSQSPGQFGGLWAADDLKRILKITGARPLEEAVSVAQIDTVLPDGAPALQDEELHDALVAQLAALVQAAQTATVAA